MKIKTFLFLFTFYVLQANYAQEITWHHLDGPMGGTVGDMRIDSKGNIYAGLNTNAFTGQIYEGIYKSTDNGDTWQKIETVNQFEVYALFINRYDHIYAGTNYLDRIYRSTDGGLTWQIINNGYSTSACWAIGENKDGTTMFAGDGQFGKLYRTTNSGANWSLVANLHVLSFAADSMNNIYCGSLEGLYKSTDDGLTWLPKGSFNTAVNPILIDQNNGIICGTGYFEGGQGVYYSTDLGETWQNIGLLDEVIYSLAFTKQGSLLAGTPENGVFETTNMGIRWYQHINGLINKDVFKIAVNDSDDIFVASQIEGISRTKNLGEQFEQVGIPVAAIRNLDFLGDSIVITSTISGVQIYNRFTKEWRNIGQYDVLAIETDEQGNIFAATNGKGLFQTSDMGETWYRRFNEPVILNVKTTESNTILAASLNGLFSSTNYGTNWIATSVSSGVDNCAIEINSNSDIWASGEDAVFFSNDNGITFESIPLNSVGPSINGLYVKSNIICIGNVVAQVGLFLSQDNGMSWSVNKFNKSIWSVNGKGNNLLVSTKSDILYSVNEGLTWDSISYPHSFYGWVIEMEYDQNDNLFFGTSSQGLYEIDIILSVEDEPVKPERIYLSQNYPNPFNPSTKIKYEIPDQSTSDGRNDNVKLKIYDVLGNEVATLVNEYKPSGSYEVEFKAEGLPSAVYFYRLSAGNYVETKKMLYLK